MSHQLWRNVNYGKEGIADGVDLLPIYFESKVPHMFPSNQSTHLIYPQINDNVQCALMMLFNLATPEWISVDCNRRFLYHTVCFMDNGTQIVKEINSLQEQTCVKEAVLIKGQCYLF